MSGENREEGGGQDVPGDGDGRCERVWDVNTGAAGAHKSGHLSKWGKKHETARLKLQHGKRARRRPWVYGTVSALLPLRDRTVRLRYRTVLFSPRSGFRLPRISAQFGRGFPPKPSPTLSFMQKGQSPDSLSLPHDRVTPSLLTWRR